MEDLSRWAEGGVRYLALAREKDRVFPVVQHFFDGHSVSGQQNLARGRSGPVLLPVDDMLSVVVRHLAHGGRLAPLTRDLFWGFNRPEAELMLSQKARARGAPTPPVLMTRTLNLPFGFYRGDVVLEAVRDARDGQTVMESEDFTDVDKKRVILTAMGQAIFALHEAGVDHADLNVMNLLVTWPAAGACGVQVIDLDKSRYFDEVPVENRIKNLSRLHRSFCKVDPGNRFTPEDWRLLLQSYAGDRFVLSQDPWQTLLETQKE